MATVNFTYALKRFFPHIQSCNIDASDIRDLIEQLELKYPGIKEYILEDHGILRKHVNIFVNNNLIRDRSLLSDKLEAVSEVYIMQALSGG